MLILYTRHYLLTLLFVLSFNVAFGQTQTLNTEALDEISSFANNFCGEYWREGGSDDIEFSGAARAQLRGLFERLADIGVEGTAEIDIDSYTGVLQEQLSDELQSIRDCRLLLWGDLRDTIFNSDRNENINTAQNDVVLEKSSYKLSEDGIRLQNSSLGPFCCTGSGIVIRTDVGDPIGYAYFFTWDGQAKIIDNIRSIVPDQDVLVSGAANLDDLLGSNQIEGRIEFDAQNPSITSGWIRVGVLEYRAVLIDFDLDRLDDKPYFKMGSLDIRLNVRLAE